nr:DUF5686 and carboxypeptidase-like regulatory domain-containing protein [uncultured Arsenicibacter sp.]
MGNGIRFVLVCWLMLGILCFQEVSAQTTFTISGRITDASTKEGVPFTAVSVKGTTSGTTSDVDGKYTLTVKQLSDSLLIASLGYQTKAVALQKTAVQQIDVVLQPAATKLQEVRVYGKGGDPAYRVLRQAVAKTDLFNPDKLSAYQYDSYTKIEAFVNEFSKPRKANRKPGPVGRLLGKLPSVTDENGSPAVPVFISENVSELYQRNQPDYTKERILKSQVRAVGITDGSLVSQFTGASFQQYNFYRNYVRVLQKDIPSPIGQNWQTMYTFHMMDTTMVGNATVYEIDFEPKRETDLAFTGTVWIDTLSLGLVQIETKVGKRANINFVDELRIDQEWEATGSGALLPVRTQVVIDTDEVTARSPGALVHFFASAKNIVTSQPKEISFYTPSIELADDYKESSAEFWQNARPETMTAEQFRAMQVVDSVRNVPFIKFTGEVLKLGFNGYQPIGRTNIDFGPLLYTYAFNSIEGNRIRLGLRTNTGFSRRWIFNGYLAYGTLDDRFKYGIGGEFIVKRKPWTVIGLSHRYDLERLGVSAENVGPSSFFLAYSRFGTIRRPYLQEQTFSYIRKEMGRGFTQMIGLRQQSFDPQFAFAFKSLSNDPADPAIQRTYNTTEIMWETRFAPDEIVLQNDNERLSFGATRKPVITFRYNFGLFCNSPQPYHKFTLDIRHSLRLGVLGRTTYTIGAGIIPSTLPYPLLFIPLGNESWFRVDNAFNLMNYFEFVSDKYASAMIEHNFEGLLFNRIPAIRRLKWRTLATAKIYYGGLSQANANLSPTVDEKGNLVQGFRTFSRTPYVEVGYGIDNIFKLFRVDAIHRLTYRTSSLDPTIKSVTPFAIKVSAWLSM